MSYIKSDKAIFLVDANSFYASCEKIFNRKLRQQPVVVLSNNDGNIVARCSIAKSLGIPMGAPFHEWKDYFLQQGVHFFSSNYELYGDISKRMISLLRNYSDEVEYYSIDEGFLSISANSREQYTTVAKNIRTTILKCLGLPV